MDITLLGRSLGCAALLAASLQAGTVLAAPAGEALDPPGEKIRITYQLFSGRPNPTVTVAPGRLYEVVTRELAGARATGTPVAERGTDAALGYTGIVLEQIAADGRVSRHVVKGTRLRIESEAGATGSLSTMSSAAKGLEAALLSIGQSYGVLDPAMLGVIARTP